ncbi:hypothetical protein [Psychrobacillus sp. FSL H8-0487]|uniref:hypothetical protein n=1 Tax=Psychrobacillus sp. FSL H8-0487 TaxID=2921391 RepID=UPI0030F516F8
MMKKSRFKFLSWLLVSILLISSYIPILPIGIGLDTEKVSAATEPLMASATISIEPSTVDTNTALTTSPSLTGVTTWYYDGVTDIIDNSSGKLLGQAYRYRTSSGVEKTMISEGSVGTWADALNGNRSYVIDKVTSGIRYSFQPPTPKQYFNRYLITEVFDAAGVSYTTTGNMIRVNLSKGPEVTNFAIKEKPSIGACYPLNSEITVELTVEENAINSNDLKVQVYVEYPNSRQASIVQDYKSTSGKFTTSFKHKIQKDEPFNFYIRAYDGIERLDVDSSMLQKTVGSVSPVGKKIEGCSAYDIQQDEVAIPMYNYSTNTLLTAGQLGDGALLVRTNNNLRSYPSNTTAWMGPQRYPTIYRGHPDDKGKLVPNINTTFEVETKNGTENIKAYRFPFVHLSGPVNPSVAKPNSMIHNSMPSTSYNVQDAKYFDYNNVSTMFNGNPSHVLDAYKYDIINQSSRKSYGEYYWIRDLAERAGGDATNDGSGGDNNTFLQIIQTDFPDIEVFELKKENSYKKNEKLNFNFNGFEYVSNTRSGLQRNIVQWSITIVEGPNNGGVIKGQINSNKSTNNPNKPYMKRYDGKYQSAATNFTPKEDGMYTVELKVVDQVQRESIKRLKFKIGEGGGEILLPPEEIIKINTPPVAYVSADSIHYWPEVNNIKTSAIDLDEDDVLTETLTVDNKIADNAWQSPRVTEKTKRNVLFTVDDGNGGKASATTTFETWPTLPTAATDLGGTLKVNRAVTLDAKASDRVSPVHVAPLEYSQTTWKITPITPGLTGSDIKERVSSDKSIKQLLFKKPGKYLVEVTVTNIYDETSEVYKRELEVVEDEVPVAEFTVDKATYLRAKADSKQTTIKLTDTSHSNDNDLIDQRIWYVEFDSNNDGYFGTPMDGGKQVIDSGNKVSVTYKTKHVGDYRFSLEVKEKFGQPTYEEFVLPHEYLRDNSDVIDENGSVGAYLLPSNFNKLGHDVGVKVDNVPPIIDFGVKRKNKVEVVLDFGGMDIATQQHQTGNRPGSGTNNGGGGGTYNHKYYTYNTTEKNSLTAYAGKLESDLRMKGLDVTVTVDNNYFKVIDQDGTCIQNIPVWNWVDYGYYLYDSYTGSSPYSGSWNVTSSSSKDIYTETTEYMTQTCTQPCTNNGGAGWSWVTGGGGFKPGDTYTDEYKKTVRSFSHTEYSASLSMYVPDMRFEVTNYQNEGCSYTEQVDTTDFVTDFANHNYSTADYKYYYRMDRNKWTWVNNTTKRNQIINKVKSSDVYFWNNSDNTLRLDAQLLNSASGKEGQYTQYDTLNLQSNVQRIRDFLINKYMILEDPENFTIVQGDEIDYTTVYEDFENDPELKREWKFDHDTTSINGRVIDGQPSSPVAQSGLYISSPMQLNEVGTFTVTLRAKDNPLSDVGNDGRFAEYQKWSDEEIVREYKINVHRRPIADFIPTVAAGTLKLTLDPSTSYDPDHVTNWSDIGIAERGIVEYTWEKYVLDGVEYSGKPPATLQALKDYYITLRVKDIDGAYGSVTKLVSTKNVNLKPVALFDSPSIVLNTSVLTDTTTQYYIRDRSYDPNGDALTNYRWTIKRQSDGVQVWTGANPPKSFASIGLGKGKYLLGLTVWDIPKYPPSLQSDLYEQEIEVIVNNPPTSCFELSRTAVSVASIPCTDGQTSPHTLWVDEPIIYTDKSSDPDGHTLINYSWIVEKVDAAEGEEHTWNTGSPPIDFNQFGGIGKYKITQRVFDNPPSPLPSLSDDYVRYFNVEKGPQAPYAMFEYAPLTLIAGDTINLNDTSFDVDGEVIEWEWKIVAPNGTTTTQKNQNPKINNAQEGIYKVTLNVWDNTLPTKLKSKIPAYKEITVGKKILKPPTAIFVWEPYKPFLGETFVLDPSASYDLDGTIVSYTWSIKSKEGVITSSTSKTPSIVADSQFYDITLTVRDNDGLTGSITERINVDIARLVPLVTHTPDWKTFWVGEGFDEDVNTFLAGEKFVIELKTTPANRVEGSVNFGGTVGPINIPSSSFKLISTSKFEYVWQTTLWREDFENIQLGGYLFNFTGYHPTNNPTVTSNGVYLIEIVGNVYEPLNFHRNF